MLTAAGGCELRRVLYTQCKHVHTERALDRADESQMHNHLLDVVASALHGLRYSFREQNDCCDK